MPNYPTDDLRFYVLMRTDMISMNAGKGHAQSAHAQKAADTDIIKNQVFGADRRTQYAIWEAMTPQGFGTTITLSVNAQQMYGVVSLMKAAGIPAGIVHDPTYPLVDGDVVHLIPVDTCGYVFGDKSEVAALLGQFSLCP